MIDPELRTWTGREPGIARIIARLLMDRLQTEGIVPDGAESVTLPHPVRLQWRVRGGTVWLWCASWTGPDERLRFAGSPFSMGACLLAPELSTRELLTSDLEVYPGPP